MVHLSEHTQIYELVLQVPFLEGKTPHGFAKKTVENIGYLIRPQTQNMKITKFNEIRPIHQIFFTYSEMVNCSKYLVWMDPTTPQPFPTKLASPIAFFGAVSGGTAASTSAFTVVSASFSAFSFRVL